MAGGPVALKNSGQTLRMQANENNPPVPPQIKKKQYALKRYRKNFHTVQQYGKGLRPKLF
jgi:hypothetical protein